MKRVLQWSSIIKTVGLETYLISSVITWFMQIKLKRGVRNIMCGMPIRAIRYPETNTQEEDNKQACDEHTLYSDECRIQNSYEQIDDWMPKTLFSKERLNLEGFGNAMKNALNHLHPVNGVCNAVSLEISSIVQVKQKWQRRQRLVCSCNYISFPSLATGDKWSKIRTLHWWLTNHLWRTRSFNYF